MEWSESRSNPRATSRYQHWLPNDAQRLFPGNKYRQGLPGPRHRPVEYRRQRPDRSPAGSGWTEENVLKNYLRPVVPPVLLVFAGCAAEYSKTEAPAQLRVDSAGSPFEGAFTGGSDCLTRSEIAKLDRMVLAGNIRPSDPVEIRAAGPLGSPGGAPRHSHTSCWATASPPKRWRSMRCRPIARSSRSAAMR